MSNYVALMPKIAVIGEIKGVGCEQEEDSAYVVLIRSTVAYACKL